MFFEKKFIVYKIDEAVKFAIECVSNIISYKCLFQFNCEVFYKKIRKLLGLDKLKILWRAFFTEKNNLILPKSVFNKNQWAEKFPVVAECLFIFRLDTL